MMKANKILNRQVFKLSREMEFFTEKELTMQIGHPKSSWHITILKELIDNALDACEVSDIQPDIIIEKTKSYFSVADNGPGVASKTIKKSLDYLIRVSDKQFYVSPTRGQMGNALKTVWAAPYVALGNSKVVIESRGNRHIIMTSLDKIQQKPQIEHSQSKDANVKNGTSVTVYWSDLASSKDEETSFYYKAPPTEEKLISYYSAFNPHTTFHFKNKTYPATDKKWGKWRTDMPTSAFWYDESRLRDLIAAYISLERDGNKPKTVREFVSEFRGLSGTQKQKQVIEGFSGMYLHDLLQDGDIDMDTASKLLKTMQEHSNPVKPYSLGLVGEEHIKAWTEKHTKIISESFNYAKRRGVDKGSGGEMPYVIEVAFAVKADTEQSRTIVTGLNWSPTLGIPADEISDAIAKARIDTHDPVILVLHMIKPRLEFTDRGKTRLAL